MRRKKTDSVPSAPVEPMVTVLIGNAPTEVNPDSIVYDPMMFGAHEQYKARMVAMQLHSFKQGNHVGVPMVFGPRPDNKYAVTGFRSN